MSALSGALWGELLSELETNSELRRKLAEVIGGELAGTSKDLDSAAAAAQLGFSRDVVVRMAKANRIPWAHKSGREWRFPSRDLRVLPLVHTEPGNVINKPARLRGKPGGPSGGFEAMMAVANSAKAA